MFDDLDDDDVTDLLPDPEEEREDEERRRQQNQRGRRMTVAEVICSINRDFITPVEEEQQEMTRFLHVCPSKNRILLHARLDLDRK